MQVRFIENVYFLFDPSMWNKEISFIFYNSYVYVCQDSQSANFEKYFVQLIHLNLNFLTRSHHYWRDWISDCNGHRKLTVRWRLTRMAQTLVLCNFTWFLLSNINITETEQCLCPPSSTKFASLNASFNLLLKEQRSMNNYSTVAIPSSYLARVFIFTNINFTEGRKNWFLYPGPPGDITTDCQK